MGDIFCSWSSLVKSDGDFSSCAYLSGLAGATALFNLVDSPVGAIPVTRVDPAVDRLPADFKMGVDGVSSLFEKFMYQNGENTVYSVQEMAGMPVGVQLIGKNNLESVFNVSG